MSRIVENINRDWTFEIADAPENREIVCIPHSIQLTPANSSGGRNLQTVCVYEKQITVERKKQKVFIEFEGLMGSSELIINGKLVKKHFCGYTPLAADITAFIKEGENLIRVVLDNRDSSDFPPGKPQHELDFCYDGGMYRCARLIYTEDIYITNPLIENEIAGGGIFVYTKNLTDSYAEVDVRTQVRNDREQPVQATLQQRIVTREGEEVALCSEEITIVSNTAEHFVQTIQVKNPNRWDLRNPYLYVLETSLICNGRIVDCIKTEFGIRSICFTLDSGMDLNGNKIRISGANYHQTYPYIGNAVPGRLLRYCRIEKHGDR